MMKVLHEQMKSVSLDVCGRVRVDVNFLYLIIHRCTGPVSFRGAEVSLSIACPKIKWFCPNITFVLPENGNLKSYRGAATPPPPRLVRLCNHTLLNVNIKSLYLISITRGSPER